MAEQVTSTTRMREVLADVVAALPNGGEVREGQQQMADAVATAIRSRRNLVVRAGTGTGKSLAYLVPALLSDKRVVVATATKALQDQLAGHDLPLIEGHLGRPFTFAVMKGRSNYLCRQRLVEGAELGEQGTLDPQPIASRPRDEQAKAILAWASTTESGDRAELSIEPDERVWAGFSVSADECPGAFRCPSGSTCFAEAARARAASADVVVTNLHLLGAHLASGDAVLPEFDALVIDEAHELEEVLSKSLGASLSPGRLRALAAIARSSIEGRLPAPLAAAAEQVFDVATRFEDLLATRVGSRLDLTTPDELSEVVALAGSTLSELERALVSVSASTDEPSTKLARTALSIGRLREQFNSLASLDDGSVAWIEGRPRPSIEIAPIDIAPMLAERVFSKTPVILTSATVPPGLAARLGADEATTDELDVGSPFAFEQHALLYCAAHLPDRRDPAAEEAIHDELAALIEAAGGRTLALFTSRRAMELAVAALRPRLRQPLVVQNEASKAQLIEEFRNSPETCLFATMGFWQGIDVPGATLSLVVIDRIPFGRPDEPLLVARREHAGPDAFRLVDLPRAASLLAQGAGRLIRTADDRGVVAVLDPRLAKASYRWTLVKALPPMRRTKDRSEAEAFLREIHDHAEVNATSSASGATRTQVQSSSS
jgi:ATP-dependent DNA helicase DinG